MEYVKCWCCENYNIFDEKTLNIPEYVAAVCDLTDSIVYAQNNVCAEFKLKQGLHTDRLIPDYCKNYRNKKEVL